MDVSAMHGGTHGRCVFQGTFYKQISRRFIIFNTIFIISIQISPHPSPSAFEGTFLSFCLHPQRRIWVEASLGRPNSAISTDFGLFRLTLACSRLILACYLDQSPSLRAAKQGKFVRMQVRRAIILLRSSDLFLGCLFHPAFRSKR